MINLLEPFGNTETFGWPISCHMPYWIENGQTLLSSAAVFNFLGVTSKHDYKCYSFHLEYHGFKNAFSGGLESDGSFISFEAFLHFLFGGLFPFCHCDKSSPSSKIPEVRRFFMEKLTKGHSIGIGSGSEAQQISINQTISVDQGEQQTGQQYGSEIIIEKCYSIQPRQSQFQGGMLNQQPADLQDNNNSITAVTRDGNRITMMEDNYLNDASDERIVTESHHNERFHVSVSHNDSQLRQISEQPQSISFVSGNVTQPNTMENSSFRDRIPLRLQKQPTSVILGMQSSEPVNYAQKQSTSQKTSTLRKDQLSQGVESSVDEQPRLEDSGGDERVQSNKFSNVVVKQENVESDLEEQQGTCSFETETTHQCNESVQIGTEDDHEGDMGDCGPIEVVHLPQEIATGASYFDPSTSSITSGRAESSNFMTSLQQGEGIGSQCESLSTESSQAVEHNNLVNQTPDSISRHIQYSHTVISSEQENSSRTHTTDCGQNNIRNKNSYAEADQWKTRMLSAPITSRHKLRKSASSTRTSNYSQQMQQLSPESGQVSFHNKRRRTDTESSTITTNIIRHPSVPSATELSSVPSWISLQAPDRTSDVRTEAHRLGPNLRDQNSSNSSVPNVTRSPVPYQRTSLLNSNIEQSSSSTAGIIPKLKGQRGQDGSDSAAAKKTARGRCSRCDGKVEVHVEHVCRTFTCTVCNKSFRRHHHLRRHAFIHTGLRPFTCSQENCGKSFARKDYYTKHLQIHVRKGT